MKKPLMDCMKGLAAAFSDLASHHADRANTLSAGPEQRAASYHAQKFAAAGAHCVDCYKSLESAPDSEPTPTSEGNRGSGGDLDGPKILVGDDLAKAFDQIRVALPNNPTAGLTLVNRVGGAPLPEAEKVDPEFRKLVEA